MFAILIRCLPMFTRNTRQRDRLMSWPEFTDSGEKKRAKGCRCRFKGRTCTSVKRFFDVCVLLQWMAWTWCCLSQKDQNACFHCPAVGRILGCVLFSRGQMELGKLNITTPLLYLTHSCPVGGGCNCRMLSSSPSPRPWATAFSRENVLYVHGFIPTRCTTPTIA